MSAKYKRLLTSFACLGAFYAPSSLALVDHVNWWTTSGNCINATNGSCNGQYADSRTFNSMSGNYQVTATAWANTSNIGGGYNNNLAAGKIAQYGGGLGVRNADYNTGGDPYEGGYPEHSMDNNDRFDMILFDFNDVQIALEQVAVGWYKNDADISVLAYTGSASFDPSDLNNRTLDATTEDLTTSGWEIVGNYDVDSFAGNNATIQSINDSNHDGHDDTDNRTLVSSSYWLIGAYNPVFISSGCDEQHNHDDGHNHDSNNHNDDDHANDHDSDQGNNCGGLDNYADYLKIKDLAGSVITTTTPPTTSVPEPGSLLLLASALFISPRLRRTRTQA